jgi:RNA polymerase sigma-70 factor (ECF subfamily)
MSMSSSLSTRLPPPAAAAPPRARATAAPIALDAEALEQLYSVARQLAGATSDADDLLHDSLERALRNAHKFQPGSNLIAWIRTIMLRIMIDGFRKRRPLTPLDRLDELASAEVEEDPWWASICPDEVRAAAALLPEPLRTAFRLLAFEGLTYRQIAARTGTPIATVGTRISRARDRLRLLLTERATATLGEGRRFDHAVDGRLAQSRRHPAGVPAPQVQTMRGAA